MVINSITFYSTPFDKEYTTVFDPLNYNNTPVTFNSAFKALSQTFPEVGVPGFTPSLYSGKSVKWKDDNFDLVVPSSIYNFMHSELVPESPNYAIVTYKTTDKSVRSVCYFVDALESGYSQGDSIKSGTCILRFTYDVWANNVYKLYYYSGGRQFLASRCTDNILAADSDNVIPNFHGVFPESEYIERPIELDESDTDYLKQRYRVAWARIKVDDSIVWDNKDNEYRLYSTTSDIPIFMYPLWIFDIEEQEILSLQVCRWYSQDSWIDFDDIVLAKSTGLVYGDITYYPPFNYQLIESGGIFFVKYQSGGLLNYTSIIQDSNGYILHSRANVNIPVEAATIGTGALLTYSFRFNTTSLASYRDSYIFSDNYFKTNSGLVDAPPKLTYAIFANGSIEPIIPLPDCTYITIDIHCDQYVPTYIIRQYTTSGIIKTKPKVLTNVGQLNLLSTAYDSYLRSNGNQIIAQQQQYEYNKIKSLNYAALGAITGGASVIAGAVTGGVTGMVSGGLTIARSVTDSLYAFSDERMSNNALQSKLNDIANAQDNYSVVTATAKDNIYQDLLLLRKLVVKDTKIYESIIRNITRYGLEYDRYVNPFTMYHDCFDYFKLQNPQFPWIQNLKHRRILEAIYRRGVTVWHYYALYLGEYRGGHDKYTGYELGTIICNPNVTNQQIEL